MNQNFRQAIADHQATTTAFKQGKQSSFEHAHARETALIAAITALAVEFGVSLLPMYRIDGNGELHIVARDGDKDPRLGCGKFGEQFVTLLNTANPRTGTVPRALSSDDGWCYVNHFGIEGIVLRYSNDNT